MHLNSSRMIEWKCLLLLLARDTQWNTRCEYTLWYMKHSKQMFYDVRFLLLEKSWIRWYSSRFDIFVDIFLFFKIVKSVSTFFYWILWVLIEVFVLDEGRWQFLLGIGDQWKCVLWFSGKTLVDSNSVSNYVQMTILLEFQQKKISRFCTTAS